MNGSRITLWAMMVGFFMVPVDATAVVVANPVIMAEFTTDHDAVLWVTSSYLLAYAVPLLVAGRLGDRFGPRTLYLAGVGLFTAASAACAVSGSLGMLVTARAFQGVGAALLTPQIMSVITRTWPRQRRGVAQGIWGTAGAVATLAGPLIGGVLIDVFGWQGIFWINVPVGVLALALAVRLVPELPSQPHRIGLFDAGLSGAAMLLIVLALQQGPDSGWAPWVWTAIAGGIGLGAAFVRRQADASRSPLVPLAILRDRNFALCCAGVLITSFATTTLVVPTMFYAQAVCGLSSLQSGLVLAPIPVIGGVLTPAVGRIIDRSSPHRVIGAGFLLLTAGLAWLVADMAPHTPLWRVVGPFCVMGVGLAFLWVPLAAASARNLPASAAGACSGVYNAAQQFGAVLGSAGLAALMASRIGSPAPSTAEGVAAAMAQSTLLPAGVAALGIVVAALMAGPRHPAGSVEMRTPASSTTGVFRPTYGRDVSRNRC